MEFRRFEGREGPVAWLKLCATEYVRCRDISWISVGLLKDGTEQADGKTVVVQLVNGTFGAFPPCESEAAAVEMLNKLVIAMAENE